MARAYRLGEVLRPLFRRHAKQDVADFAQALEGAGLVRTGELVRRARALKPKIRRWGYQVPFHLAGQLVTWLTRGTADRTKRKTGQRVGRVQARPLPNPDEERAQELAAELEGVVAGAFEAWDRSVR